MGIIADVALTLNILFVMAILAGFGGTLTLPGIAGIILTIGMSVDANVLIFERIREELDSGKTVRDWLPMSPKMKWKFNQFTASAGVTEVEPGQVDLADFQGQFVRATISQETYLRNDQTTGLRNVVRG